MPARRRVSALAGLLAALAALVVPTGSARAQAPPLPPSDIDCGPGRVNVNDLVTLNVGNPSRSTTPVVLVARLVDAAGAPLVEETLTLGAGQSQTVFWTAKKRGAPLRQFLVRGEIDLLGEETDLLPVIATMQVFRPGLTYGPNFLCRRGDTGGRGPV
jgi:hypothetical protein